METTPLTTETFALSGGLCVRAAGEVDLVTGPQFRAAVFAALAATAGPVTLDLTRVVYADTSGLMVLQLAAKRRPDPSALRVLVREGGGLARVLRLTRLLPLHTAYLPAQ